MDPKLYKLRRDELISLVDETLNLQIPEPHLGELKRVKKKCNEDQFEIALVGEFQGGKSTTFNTLCDGREISPRGLAGGGLPTSAAIVTAQHISEPSESKDGLSEWAEISWRNNYDIMLGVAGLVKGYLVEDAEFMQVLRGRPASETFTHSASPEQVAALVDLEDPSHRAAVGRAISAEWENQASDKAAYSSAKLDLLKIATLQIRFLGSEEWRRLTSKTIYSIPEFQTKITFPRDWTPAWVNGENSSFSISEISFVFVSDVLVRIRAKNLSRIGCRVTDCPGLFASAWDTALARAAMSRADSVWYLLNGEKHMGSSDNKIVRFVIENGMSEKLRVSLNLRGGKSHEAIFEDILPADQATMTELGLPCIKVEPYDARLAFLASQGQMLLSGSHAMGEYDRRCMAFEYDRKMALSALQPEVAWCKFVRIRAANAGLANLENVNALDESSVAAARTASRLDEILGRIETDAIALKAKSILIDQGSRLASAALRRYEGDLEAKELAAISSLERYEKQVRESRVSLDDFIRKSQEIIEGSVLDQDSVEIQMSEEFTCSIFNARLYERIGELAAQDVHDASLSYFSTKEELREAFEGIIASALAQAYKDRYAAVVQDWTRGNGEAIKRFNGRCERVVRQIQEYWGYVSSEELLSGITLAEGLPPDFLASHMRALSGNVVSVAKDLSEKMNAALWVSLVAVLLKPLEWVCDRVVDVRDILNNVSEVEKKRRVRLKLEGLVREKRATIVDSCERAFGNSLDVRGKIIEEHRRTFGAFRVSCKSWFLDLLQGTRKEFDDRVADAEKSFRLANDERERIGYESRAIRTNQIAPIRARVDRFEATVRKDLDG